MITFSQLLKIMPEIKEEGFYYKILDEHNPFPYQWIWHTDFLNKYDCKKLQVIRVCHHFHYSDDTDIDYEITMKKITEDK